MKQPEAYKEAGVDIEAGEAFVRMIAPLARSTFRPEVAMDIGGFGAAIAIDWRRYREPLLVASTDGVGTKLRLAFLLDRHETVGVDLVAMCANDVVVQGAEPLFFLDYFATGTLDPRQAYQVLEGIASGCTQAGCALVGGETAEMPSFYPKGEYELAGFCVGVVEKSRLLTGSTIAPGDVVLGLASSGLHSNGYSLARKVFLEEGNCSLAEPLPGLNRPLGEELLEPTRIYVRPVLRLLERVPVQGLAHITGGGLLRNIPRVLPPSCTALLAVGAWPVPPIFSLIEQRAAIPLEEMLQTFNYGIGMVVITRPEDASRAEELLEEAGEKVYRIGSIVPRDPGFDPVVLRRQ
jgi:phosphoribosylformylglycinamidine cyclo-ligase